MPSDDVDSSIYNNLFKNKVEYSKMECTVVSRKVENGRFDSLRVKFKFVEKLRAQMQFLKV